MPGGLGGTGFSTPFHAPLYTGPVIEYWDVEAVIALGLFDRASVESILPEGLEPAGDPVLGALWVGRYPFSTVGSYNEFLVAIQVLRGGELGYYVPYIYVTNDAALAAGREVLGAPKKLAEITLERGVYSTVLGAARRGYMEAVVEVRPEGYVEEPVIRSLLPEEGVNLYSIRSLPPAGESPGIAQLVHWKAFVHFARRPSGRISAMAGPARVHLRGSLEDPIDSLGLKAAEQGFYAVFDMQLKPVRVVGEWRIEP